MNDSVEVDDTNEEMLNLVSVHLRMSESKLKEFKMCMREDEELSILLKRGNLSARESAREIVRW